MRSHEQSLHRLGLPKVDVVLIHDADAWTHGPVEGPKRYREAMDGAYRALEKLRGEGVIKGIGIGLNDPVYAARYLRDGDFDCLLLAGRYSLLEQPALAEVLPLAAQKNVGVMLGGVFNSGILATGPIEGARYNYTPAPPEILDKVRRIERVCAAHGVALPTAAMHFCLGHAAVSSLVLGAVKPDEVRRNVAAMAAQGAGRALGAISRPSACSPWRHRCRAEATYCHSATAHLYCAERQPGSGRLRHTSTRDTQCRMIPAGARSRCCSSR